MGNPEAGYIYNLDRELHPRPDLGHDTEEVVLKVFQNAFGPEVSARPSTPEEDAGYQGTRVGKMIDAVVYLRDKPAMGVQITSARDKDARQKKIDEMLTKPFLRLPEMKPTDPSIPRVLIWVDSKEVASFKAENELDPQKHKRMFLQIIDGTINSLKVALLKTSNEKEIYRLNTLLQLFGEEKKKIEFGKK